LDTQAKVRNNLRIKNEMGISLSRTVSLHYFHKNNKIMLAMKKSLEKECGFA
jgi:hypothetical protein